MPWLSEQPPPPREVRLGQLGGDNPEWAWDRDWAGQGGGQGLEPPGLWAAAEQRADWGGEDVAMQMTRQPEAPFTQGPSGCQIRPFPRTVA